MRKVKISVTNTTTDSLHYTVFSQCCHKDTMKTLSNVLPKFFVYVFPIRKGNYLLHKQRQINEPQTTS